MSVPATAVARTFADFLRGFEGARDPEQKFAANERAGVGECWLIDTDRCQAGFFVRSTEGRFVAVPCDDQGRDRREVLPGLWLDTGWLWRQPLLKLIDVLKARRLFSPAP